MGVLANEYTRWDSLQEDPAQLGALLCTRIRNGADRLRAEFGAASPQRIRWCRLDNLLPDSVVTAVYNTLKPFGDMIRLKNIKEHKFVSADLGKLSPNIVNVVLAFAQPEVSETIGSIVGEQELQSDRDLNYGGVTVMVPGDYMRPHLGNSHDHSRRHRRGVALLCYLTPFWDPAYDGSLKLWYLTRQQAQAIIAFRPNRLVVLETSDWSWHAVRSVAGPLPRVSVMPYLYDKASDTGPVRLTRFASRPSQPVKNILFSGQFHLRSAAYRIIGRSVGNKYV